MSDNRIELSGIFEGGYGVVPKKLMKAKDINSNTKLILCYLLSYTGAGMTCFPSMDLIAEDLSISKRTIIRCLKSCIENGYLEKEQKQRGRGIGKQNIYHLLFMKDFTSAKKSRAKKNASDKASNASAKNDVLQVTPGNCNNNSINNNTNNNKVCTDWNELAKQYSLPLVNTLSTKRKEKYKLRHAEGLRMSEIGAKIARSGFLRGQNERGWKIDFDWLITNDTNWLKVIEDKYQDKTEPKTTYRKEPLTKIEPNFNVEEK